MLHGSEFTTILEIQVCDPRTLFQFSLFTGGCVLAIIPSRLATAETGTMESRHYALAAELPVCTLDYHRIYCCTQLHSAAHLTYGTVLVPVQQKPEHKAHNFSTGIESSPQSLRLGELSFTLLPLVTHQKQ